MPSDAMIACGAAVPIRRRVLVTGHPRAGTGYAAAVCKAAGLDVGHESMGTDGVSSWMMAPPVWRVPFHREWSHRGRNWYTFDQVIEIVREPLAHIASVAFTESDQGPDQKTSLWWRAAWVPLEVMELADPVAQAVQSIVGWHEAVRAWLPGAAVVKLEDATTHIPSLLGVKPGHDPGIVNAREHKSLTWGEVRERCTSPLWDSLMDYTANLGYGVPQ